MCHQHVLPQLSKEVPTTANEANDCNRKVESCTNREEQRPPLQGPKGSSQAQAEPAGNEAPSPSQHSGEIVQWNLDSDRERGRESTSRPGGHHFQLGFGAEATLPPEPEGKGASALLLSQMRKQQGGEGPHALVWVGAQGRWQVSSFLSANLLSSK